MRNYKIPTEVSSELKISKSIYLFDLMLIVFLILFRFMTIDYVHSDFRIWYTIFLIAFGLFMIIRPKTNPQKRMYQAMYYAIVRKKNTYTAIDYSKGEWFQVVKLNEKNLLKKKKENSTAILDEKNVISEKKVKDKKAKVKSSFGDISPVVDITNNDFFEMRSGEFLEIIQIETKDIYSLNSSDLNDDVNNLSNFYTAFTSDIKIVPLNVPLNLEDQKDHIYRQIKKCKNAVYKALLEERLKELQVLEQSRTNREYFIFLYADEEKKLLEKLHQAKMLLSRSNPPVVLTVEKKINILFQMFNPNTKPLGESE